MRRLILFVVAIFMVSAISGCTHHKPEFNQTYLPNSVPGSPQKRIDLPKLVTDKALVKRWSLFGKSTTYLPTSLYWVEEDNLLFNIASADNKSLLHSFLIIPSTGEVKLLEGAEKYTLLGKTENNVSFASTETKAGIIAKEIGRALAAFAFQADPGGKRHYVGQMENNGTVLHFDITIREKGASAFSTALKYSSEYVVKNRQTGSTVEGRGITVISQKVDEAEYEFRKWLKSWRVSPDGRYYVIGNTATFADPAEGTFTTLIENYEHAYAGFDISPRWDKIALLNIKEDEKTKQVNYWIEFYAFDYRKNNEEASTR